MSKFFNSTDAVFDILEKLVLETLQLIEADVTQGDKLALGIACKKFNFIKLLFLVL
jgi:hypothetical protein